MMLLNRLIASLTMLIALSGAAEATNEVILSTAPMSAGVGYSFACSATNTSDRTLAISGEFISPNGSFGGGFSNPVVEPGAAVFGSRTGPFFGYCRFIVVGGTSDAVQAAISIVDENSTTIATLPAR